MDFGKTTLVSRRVARHFSPATFPADLRIWIGINSVTAGLYPSRLRFKKYALSEKLLAESMQAVTFPARQTRSHYRHELRTLTYVTLNEGNGGIIRNLSHDGVAVQAVAPLRPEQRVRLRFELRFPRLRVDVYGLVSWSNSSGQCGVRFAELPERTRRQIDQWIFSNLLDSCAREAQHPHSIFGPSLVPVPAAEEDGLIHSRSPRAAIRLESNLGASTFSASHAVSSSFATSSPANSAIPAFEPFGKSEGRRVRERAQDLVDAAHAQLNWLSRPLSARTLAWLVDSLVMTAGMLVFALIFLSIAHELPQWPLTLSGALAAAVFVAACYWSLFTIFGGPTLGGRLAQTASGPEGNQQDDDADRFR